MIEEIDKTKLKYSFSLIAAICKGFILGALLGLVFANLALWVCREWFFDAPRWADFLALCFAWWRAAAFATGMLKRRRLEISIELDRPEHKALRAELFDDNEMRFLYDRSAQWD